MSDRELAAGAGRYLSGPEDQHSSQMLPGVLLTAARDYLHCYEPPAQEEGQRAQCVTASDWHLGSAGAPAGP